MVYEYFMATGDLDFVQEVYFFIRAKEWSIRKRSKALSVELLIIIIPVQLY